MTWLPSPPNPGPPAPAAPTIAGIGAYATWIKVGDALGYASFSAAATSRTNTLFSLVAGGVIEAVKVKHSTAFSGGAISAVTMEVGIAGTTDKYASAFDVFQATGATTYFLSESLGGESQAAATDITITARSTSANLDALTAGVVDVWVLVSKAT